MALATFYFQLHQPYRLHPDGTTFLWNQENEWIFRKVAHNCYLPATRMFIELIEAHPEFKITFSMSGTFLEQAEQYQPEVIETLARLYDAGRANNQVEFLQETYYHSLVSLYADPEKTEFKEQVSLHRRKMNDLFGIKPTAFRNTELMYNNEIANVVADMGFEAMLCEQRDDMFTPKDDQAISPNAVFRAKGRRGRGRRLMVLPRNRNLSDDVAFRFPQVGLAPEQYAEYLGKIDGEAVLLGYDYEHIGEHIWADKGIFEFWKALPKALAEHPGVVMANPTEVAKCFQKTDCPILDIHPLATSSWADVKRDTKGWLGSYTQHKLFRAIEHLEPEVRRAGRSLLNQYRYLTTSDHLYYLHEGQGADRVVHEYFSPYGALSAATYVLTHTVSDLIQSVKSFNIIKGTEKTAVIVLTPETARLPSEGMGQFAQFVSGKSGGMGEVVSALCKGLSERQVPVHLVTLNLSRRFREESGLTEEEWYTKRHEMDQQYIRLVTSSVYEDYHSAYDGNPAANAVEYQRQVVNTTIRDIRSQYEGRAIIHSNDWMAGGVISAYAGLRGVPVLHTIHNTHTGHIPVDMFHGVNLGKLWTRLYLSEQFNKTCVDCQATALKNATMVSYVGNQFLREIVEDYFLDRHIVPPSVREETKVKWHDDKAAVIPNGISPDVLSENQPENPDMDSPGLAMAFGPDDDLIEAKGANLAKFQRQMGLTVDPNAILFFWPSRLDPVQKGIELLEDIAQSFVIQHPDAQIAVVGNPVGSDSSRADIMGRIAVASNGRVAYRRFNEALCQLGYAAAHDVFGASVYEPFGQIDVVGNLYGATATNRDTGGYRDKIARLRLKVWGALMDSGNGVLFKDYNSSGLWWGLEETLKNHRYFKSHPDEWVTQMRRIMSEAREKWSLDSMVAGYVTLYEQLNGGKPLA